MLDCFQSFHRVQVNISDVRDEHSMRYLVQGQDYLLNLAGQTSHLDSMQDPYADLEINCRRVQYRLNSGDLGCRAREGEGR